MKMHKLEKFFVNSDIFNLIYKRTVYNSFFKFIGKELKGRLLEIGCGIGRTTHFLADKYKKLEITAIDYDKEQIKLAKKNKKLKNIKFFQGDVTNTNFKTSSFDYVIETNTFHHVKNYPKAIKEVFRVLKKNGTFYLMDISKYFFIWPVYLFFPPEVSFSKKEFIKNLEDSNFKVEKSKGNLVFFIATRKTK